MTNQKPRYHSQGVNFLGFLAKQLGDLHGITTLAHELIQNADDAKDDSGRFSATKIEFDLTDDALVVSNDATFREIDFQRMTVVANPAKRSEGGPITTGAFGIGFISVYQVTDCPEIHSSGRRWIIRPDNTEDRRIEEWVDTSMTDDKGTVFKLPWAFNESIVRRELRSPTIAKEDIVSFVEELEQALPNAILFLKNLEQINLYRNGEVVIEIRRSLDGKTTIVDAGGEIQRWRIFDRQFDREALELKSRYRTYIEDNRSSCVKLAIPSSGIASGLLYATLPTEDSTDLPFHIDADFFPDSDRKSIEFGDSLDHRSQWNRLALQATASVLKANLIEVRDMFQDDADSFWETLTRVHDTHQRNIRNTRKPLGAFWTTLLPSLADTPIVFTESGKWIKPGETHLPTGRKEELSVSSFEALNFNIVHRSLWNRRNLLTRNDIGVQRLTLNAVFTALNDMGLTHRPSLTPRALEDRDLMERLWTGIHGIYENSQGRAREEAKRLLGICTLAPGTDGRLWPCSIAYRADELTRSIFHPMFSSSMTFLTEFEVPLFEEICPNFAPETAVKILETLNHEHLHQTWMKGQYQPSTILSWFDDRKASLTDSTRERLASVPLFPTSKGLRPIISLWLPGGFQDPLNVAELLDTSQLGGLIDFLRYLGARNLTFEDYAKNYIGKAFIPGARVSKASKLHLLDLMEKRFGEIRGNLDLRRSLSSRFIVECTDGTFRQPRSVYIESPNVRATLGDQANYANVSRQMEGRRDLYSWMGVATRLRPRDVITVISQHTSVPPTRDSRESVRAILDSLGVRWSQFKDSEKSEFDLLKSSEWVPAENDLTRWHRPDSLYASYNKSLFESQAQFIDLPVARQQAVPRLSEAPWRSTQP